MAQWRDGNVINNENMAMKIVKKENSNTIINDNDRKYVKRISSEKQWNYQRNI
jgi:hypothetical protein